MTFHLAFSENNASFHLDFGEVTEGGEYDLYTGSYEVVPKVTEQSLATHSKMCSADIHIQAIPYYEVENVNHGNTAIIGG